MKNKQTNTNYSGPYFILNHHNLQPGDIILEHGYEPHSDIICRRTNSNYSHAMIYVGGTIIEATRDGGVFSRIPNRSVVRNINDFCVLRLTKGIQPELINNICLHARYLVGSLYSVTEAILVKGNGLMRAFSAGSRKQFCSRLVAQCYQKHNINLVSNADFCSPADIENSPLLQIVPNIVRPATDKEVRFALAISPHAKHNENAMKFIKAALSIFYSHGIKTIGNADKEILITTFNDISHAVFKYKNTPNLDDEITKAMYESGYLDHIDMDKKQNPFRYDYKSFKNTITYNSSNDMVLQKLEIELRKESEVFKTRLESYVNGKNNLASNMKYFEAEYLIAKSLIKGMHERLTIIEKFTKDNRINKINEKCNKMIDIINRFADDI